MQFSKWLTLGVCALFLVVVATMLGAEQLYPMAALLLTLPAISYAFGWAALQKLRFVRELPSLAWEGEETQIVYRVANPTKLSRYFLSIREGVPGWMQFTDPEPPLFNVGAEDETRVSYRLVFRRRGVYRVASFEVSAMDPLGIFAFSQKVRAAGEQVVFPMPRHLEALPLTPTEKNGWLEWTTSALNGDSVTPDGVREYRQGDSLRRVHWRQTARTGQLSVIEFEEEQSVTLRVILDATQSGISPEEIETPLESLIRFAASALYLAIKQGAAASLLLTGITPPAEQFLLDQAAVSARGETHLFELLEALARTESGRENNLVSLLESQGANRREAASLLVLTSNLTEATVETLCRLSRSGSRVHLVFCDPATFPRSARRLKTERTDPLFARLNAAGVSPALLRYSLEGELYPENIGETH